MKLQSNDVVWYGKAGNPPSNIILWQARHGKVWLGGAGYGLAWQVWQGEARFGMVWQVRHGEAWYGNVRFGWVWFGRYG